MNSFGDVFSQSYEASKVSRDARLDKTCSAGVGCDAVKVSSEYIDAAQRWLDEAQRQMFPASENEKNAVDYSETSDARPLMKREVSF
jgi:hypothetical protein